MFVVCYCLCLYFLVHPSDRVHALVRCLAARSASTAAGACHAAAAVLAVGVGVPLVLAGRSEVVAGAADAGLPDVVVIASGQSVRKGDDDPLENEVEESTNDAGRGR